MTTPQPDKQKEEELKHENVLNRKGIGEEDYMPTVGTSDGVTSLQNPKTVTETGTYQDNTTDYNSNSK